MSAADASLMSFARGNARGGPVHLDTVTLALTGAIVLLGLVMVTSASVSIAAQETGQPFYYLERQLLLTLIGAACAAVIFATPTRVVERASGALLALAMLLLLLVLVPGLGHTVNGSRRWLHVAGLNFQVSELSRVLVLLYVASYAVRRENELRESFPGLVKPLGAAGARLHCCCSRNRISAPPRCCSRPASRCCSWPGRGCATCSP